MIRNKQQSNKKLIELNSLIAYDKFNIMIYGSSMFIKNMKQRYKKLENIIKLGCKRKDFINEVRLYRIYKISKNKPKLWVWQAPIFKTQEFNYELNKPIVRDRDRYRIESRPLPITTQEYGIVTNTTIA